MKIVSLMMTVLALATGATAEEVVVNGRQAAPQENVTAIPTVTPLLSVTNGTATSTTAASIDLPPNSDVGIWLTYAAGGAATGIFQVGFDLTYDKTGATGFSTTQPITLTSGALNGTNVITQYFTVSRTNWTGAARLKFTKLISTNANAVVITPTTLTPVIGGANPFASPTTVTGIPTRYLTP